MNSSLGTVMGRLRLKQLQLLMALDDHDTLHQAANAMAMTQSAASKALAELESIVGMPLFERSKGRLVVNDYGRCVIRYARLLANETELLFDEFSRVRSGTGGRLLVGTIMGAIPDLVAPAVNEMQKSHPRLTIDVVEETSGHLLQLIDDGHLDLAIARSSVGQDSTKYDYEPLSEEPLCVVVHHDHPLARQKSVELPQLAGHRWITYPLHMPLYELLKRELDLAQLPMPVHTVSSASTFFTIALLRQADDLVSLLPKEVADFFSKQKLIRVLPVRLKSRSPTFGIVTSARKNLSPIALKFVQLLRARSRQRLVRQGPQDAVAKGASPVRGRR